MHLNASGLDIRAISRHFHIHGATLHPRGQNSNDAPFQQSHQQLGAYNRVDQNRRFDYPKLDSRRRQMAKPLCNNASLKFSQSRTAEMPNKAGIKGLRSGKIGVERKLRKRFLRDQMLGLRPVVR
jgi:hypothetical protein